jgi:hypothetical protein
LFRSPFRSSIALLAFAAPALIAQKPSPEGITFFEKNIRPVLAANCYPCHSSKLAKPMSGLRLDSRAGTLRGGQSGAAAVVPGKPEESLLIAAVKGTNSDLKMPPGKTLSAAEISALEEWIRIGAPDPREEAAGSAPAPVTSYDWKKAREHWSFQPVKAVDPPHVASAEWNKSELDRFIRAKLDEKGLTPQGLASKAVLIRRATYDLTGLPPTPEETDAFLKDTSPDAYEKLVDRLLASWQYGERWGRKWLDVVRYSDTAGDNSDYPVPAMYRYRNWVIDAFNRDQPYDQFIRDQIAGDIYAKRDNLAVKDIEEYQRKIIATGYLANSRRFGANGQDLNLVIDDTIDNLGKGILGLSTSCARCHDHKFDPIPTADYYALYGIFKSSKYPHPGSEIYKHERDFTALNPAQSDQLKAWEAKLNSLDERWENGNKKIGSGVLEKMREGKADHEDVNTDRADLMDKDPNIPRAYAMMEGTPATQKIMVKGDTRVLGPDVPRGFLTILGGQKVPADEKGSGREELAQWLTDSKNPLTARVMVNRIWLGHFGRGLVATPDDFGARGDKPANPELLDWLATYFVQHGYSVKAMQRLIMLSRTYRMASTYNEADANKDPDNAYLWRFNRRRLDAEEFRDTLLMDSGKLDLKPGGEHPFPNEVGWLFTEHNAFIADDATYSDNKRSVYMLQQRIRRNRFLELFDGPDSNTEMGLRPQTTSALQALYRMNDPFFHEQAAFIAARVGLARNSDIERLQFAWKLLYGRLPDPIDIRTSEKFLMDARADLKETGMPEDQRIRESWESLMRVLLGSNEFLTLD